MALGSGVEDWKSWLQGLGLGGDLAEPNFRKRLDTCKVGLRMRPHNKQGPALKVLSTRISPNPTYGTCDSTINLLIQFSPPS